MVGYGKCVPSMQPMASPYVKVGADLGLRHKLLKQCHFLMVSTQRWFESNWRHNIELSCRKRERKKERRDKRSVIKAVPVFTLTSTSWPDDGLTHLPNWETAWLPNVCFITCAEHYFPFCPGASPFLYLYQTGLKIENCKHSDMVYSLLSLQTRGGWWILWQLVQ